ncbi:MFS transporter [Oceanobacillus sp. FSL K6-2867]|uniref:MFS transporter n=1 Tax=Oceanobacillus sp. FSL K6-2867 TaxID=2954748 RepID=UPI0030D9E8BD
MSTDKVLIDDLPLNKFHWKVTIYTAGGPFCDGYILSIIGIALALLAPQLGLSPLMIGLIGSSALVGIFFGGLIFGYLTDIIGRKTMYILDLVVFVVASVLQFFVGEGWQLLILRFVLGVAVGADYPIATSLLAEFTPRKHRGFMLSFLVLGWWVGAVAAFIVGYLLMDLGENSWRWILASSAVPSLIVLFLRAGTPESPKWLVSKGRIEEARVNLQKAFGEGADLGDIPAEPPKTSFLNIFRGGYDKRTIFMSVFWMMQVVPTFAIMTFAPSVLSAFGFNEGNTAHLGAVITSAFFLIGALITLFLVNKIGRRHILIWPFLITGITLFLLGIVSEASIGLIIGLFAIFAIFNGGSSVLQYVYPNELFPTEIRATAVGFGTAMSRVGAAVGTFLLPISMNGIGIGTTMIIGAVLCFIGFIVSLFMAPETRHLTLEESSRIDHSRNVSANKRTI